MRSLVLTLSIFFSDSTAKLSSVHAEVYETHGFVMMQGPHVVERGMVEFVKARTKTGQGASPERSAIEVA